MKIHPSLLTVLSAAALTACASHQYTEDLIESQAVALVRVSVEADRPRSLSVEFSGVFERDVAGAVRAWPDYLAAQSAAIEAQSLIMVSQAARKPQIRANSNFGRLTEAGTGIATSTTDGASASLTMSQIIYDGGASLAAIDGAQAAAYAAEIETRIVANTAAYEAGIAWIDIQTIRERQSTLSTVINKANEMLGQIDTLVASGMVDKSASTSGDIAVRNLELEKLQLETIHQEALARYTKHFGAPPAGLKQAPRLLTESDIARIKEDWATSPNLLQSATGILIAKQELLAAQGREKPTIGLSSGINSPMSRTDQSSYALGFEVNWIIGDGGRRQADTAAKAARLESATQALASLNLQAKSQLDTALSQRETLLKSLTILTAQNRASSNEIKVLLSQLAIGQTTVRQLIDAEVGAYRTADRQIAAKAELVKLELKMLATSGLLSQKLGLNDTQAPMKDAK